MRRQPEVAAVEDEVALDARESLRPQVRHERLPLLDGDLRVAGAAQDQVPAQRAVDQRPAEEGLGAPAVVAAQHLQRGERGDELHRRGRVEGLVRVEREQRPRRPDTLHATAAFLSDTPLSRNARATTRGSSADAGAAASAQANPSHARLCRIQDVQGGVAEQREVRVVDHVGRHEVHRVADRSQQHAALRAPARSTSGRTAARSCPPRTPRSCRAGGNCARADAWRAAPVSAVEAAARARLAASTSSCAKMSSVGQRRAAGQRITGVGVRMQEAARDVVVVEGLVNLVRGQHHRQRQVAAGDAFGQAEKVGRDAGLLAGEQRSGAPEARQISSAIRCTS